ncbi:hypothetical protein SM41311_00835 [Xanthomonas hortorum pv. gardneri]|nr:hypothetical protein SM41311_00835 [Xanthomonas hortorum pv. gardneri]
MGRCGLRLRAALFGVSIVWSSGRLAATWPIFRAANKTTALTARRARQVLGIGMYHLYTAVLSTPSTRT